MHATVTKERLHMISIYCELMPEDGFGVMCLQLPQGCFPDDTWEDFGGAMAFEWLRRTVLWLEGHAVGECRYSFFDGPYEFHIADAGSNSLSMTFFERTPNGLITHPKFAPLTVSRSGFFVSLLHFVGQITWQSNADKVSRLVDELRRSM
jgi:hypothetical protein